MGYVKKRKVHINEPDIYFLGLRGKRYIASLGGCSQQEVERIAGVSGGVAEAPVLMMGHDLTLSSLYVDAVLGCRRNGWELHWENSRMLEIGSLGVQPDAYLRVAGKGVSQQAFLELTAVPPTKAEMRDKLDGYRPLLEQMGGCPILWLTTSRHKLEYLKREVAEWLYHDYVLLGLVEERSGFLTKPMWHWSEGEELVRFIRPNKVVVYRAGGQPDP